MKKRLLVLFFTLTFALTACATDAGSTKSIDEIIVNNLVEDIEFTVTDLDSDIVIPTYVDGYILTWASNDASHLTSEGVVTQPADGEGDATVVLTVTATSNDASVTKDFTFIVK